ncbi:MAG TPA: hypothetical protein VNW46_05635 [Gemmatimonadaceae bacterium]|nr:hypothetical protein [Gemmatimonadaceae bacterium]
MSLLAPVFFIVAVGAAAAATALHFIVMRQPPRDVLPTARFVPIGPAVARTVARRPEDLVLLLLRVAALLMIGAAFAHPVWHRRRAAVLHVVVADRSRAVADVREVADSAGRIASGVNDVLVAFDSSPRVIATSLPESLAAMRRTGARARLSAALVSALRAAGSGKDRADSIEVTVVSPVAAEEVDAATDSIRGLWPGAVRLVRVAARADAEGRLVRPTVHWPDDGHVATARGRTSIDTVNAIVTGRVVVVAPFERRWQIDTTGARVIARWVDGVPAAVERTSGVECVRDVAVPVPSAGDVVLRPEWQRFVGVTRGACGRDASSTGGRLAAWAIDSARPSRVAASALSLPTVVPNPLVTWLLAGAVIALLLEVVARRAGALQGARS